MENGGKGKDNPFSFKNFLKGNQDTDSAPGRRNANEDADNPFSFRKFLNQGKSSEIKQTYGHNADLSRSQDTANSSSKSSAQAANSSSFENYSDFVQELPDFIQDHLELKYEDDKTESNEHLYNSNDNYSHTDTSRDTYENSESLIEDGQAEASLESYNENSVSVSQNDSIVENQAKNENYCGLPDFISGTSKSETVVKWSSHLDESNCINHSQSTLEDEIFKLREENAFLHEQLEKVKRTKDIQASKIIELEQKIIHLQEAETQETVALEKMVQQVELNLKVTTERALLAEGHAAKLKQELKTLQALFKNVMKENDKLSGNCSDRECISEKANSLASQIKVAADSAEQPLRKLIEGVDHLRLLSTLVSSIGKVEEN